MRASISVQTYRRIIQRRRR